MAAHSRILGWRIRGEQNLAVYIQSMGSQRVRQDLATKPPPGNEIQNCHVTQQSHSWVYICRQNCANSKAYVYSRFIAALFTTTKTWKRGKCPPAEEWRKRAQHIQTWTAAQA